MILFTLIQLYVVTLDNKLVFVTASTSYSSIIGIYACLVFHSRSPKWNIVYHCHNYQASIFHTQHTIMSVNIASQLIYNDPSTTAITTARTKEGQQFNDNSI